MTKKATRYTHKTVDSKGIQPKKMAKVWGFGTVPFAGIEIDAFILEDGTALIGTRKILKVLGRGQKGDYANQSRPAFLAANNLQKFIGEELEEKLKGIQIKNSGWDVSVYHADILPLICYVYIDANKAGVLSAPQKVVAERCEILVRTFSKVGIVALIYEQLGYEKYKHPEALKMLVDSYLADEVRKYSTAFPDELFRQMDRIYGNEKTTSRNRPRYYAQFIRKYIYQPLLKGNLLKKLDEVNPTNEKGHRKHRHHQHTSEEIGLPAITEQIWQVVGVLKTSANKRVFENNFERLMGQAYQINLFDVDE